MRHRSLVFISAAALCLLAGCSGGGSTSSTSASSSSGSTTATAPAITTQPSSQSVAAGASVSFAVVATSSTTLSYQWYKGSSAISGASSASYTISSVASTDAGSYYVVVTNSAGSTTSSTATLTVTTSTTASCDTTYVNSVLTALSSFKSALGTTLSAKMQYDSSSYSSSQLNVYKTDWSNLPPGAISFTRPGITLSQLTSSAQITAMNTLISTALAAAGYETFQGILAADDYLGYTKNASGYGAELYHVAIIGTPSQTGSWSLMLGGHHMAFNIAFNAGCAYPTPNHVAVEPRTSFTANNHYTSSYGTAVYGSGTYQVLDDQASAMVAIFSSMSSSQLSSAFLTSQTYSDIYIGPVEANTGSYSTVTTKFNTVASISTRGILVSDLSSTQQALVSAAISIFIDSFDSTTASRLLSDYISGYGSTYVAWANASGSYSSSGPNVATNGTYMRIDGPRVWIEIACQNGVIISGQTHYHMIYRDKTYDYYNELGS